MHAELCVCMSVAYIPTMKSQTQRWVKKKKIQQPGSPIVKGNSGNGQNVEGEEESCPLMLCTADDPKT